MLNLPLCHWSSQLFDLCAPSSADVPVLSLNQPNASQKNWSKQFRALWKATLLNIAFFLTRQWQEPISSGQIEKKTGGGSLSRHFRKKKMKRGFYCNKMNTLTCSNLRLSFTTIEAKKKDCNLGMKKIGFFSKLFVLEKKAILKLMLIFSEVG